MQKFFLDNLDCSNCAAKLEKAIQHTPGVDYARIDYVTNQLFVDSVEIMFNFLRNRGFSVKQIDDLVKEARSKKGIIIGYSEDLFRNGKPLQGNDGFDVRVQDVDISSIVGIEPLDRESYDFLNSL